MKKYLIITILITSLLQAYPVNDRGLALTPETTIKLCKPLKRKIDRIIGSKDISELTVWEKTEIMVLEFKVKLYCQECRVPYTTLEELGDL